jgi:hypothetical protein
MVSGGFSLMFPAVSGMAEASSRQLEDPTSIGIRKY